MGEVLSLSSRAMQKAAEQIIIDKAVALGNSYRTWDHVAADLVNAYVAQYGRKGLQRIADGSGLSVATVERVGREAGTEWYGPKSDTIIRLMRFFGREVSFKEVHITPKYQNKPKPER